jgi:hypothetical protein
MKKIILSFWVLILLAYYTYAQNKLHFKVSYKPQTQYNQSSLQSNHSEIKYSGPKEFLQKLKEKGVQNPTITDTEMKIESVFRTGALTDGTDFPIVIEFVKIENSNDEVVLPEGTLIYGHGSVGNMPALDSIVANGLDEEFKNTFLKTMQSTFSQLSFPEKQVKVGESFSIETPLTIPIADVTIEMTITTNYKLLSITDGVADFKISQVYTMKTLISKYTIKAKGSGKGKLLYDVANNFYMKYEVDTEMEMNMKIEEMTLDLNSKTGIIQTTSITAN